MDMKPSPKNPANQSNPHSRLKTRENTGSVGGETKADVKGAARGQPTDGLKGAIGELKSQNHEMGYLRHEPLAGLKPRGGKND